MNICGTFICCSSWSSCVCNAAGSLLLADVTAVLHSSHNLTVFPLTFFFSKKINLTITFFFEKSEVYKFCLERCFIRLTFLTFVVDSVGFGRRAIRLRTERGRRRRQTRWESEKQQLEWIWTIATNVLARPGPRRAGMGGRRRGARPAPRTITLPPRPRPGWRAGPARGGEPVNRRSCPVIK